MHTQKVWRLAAAAMLSLFLFLFGWLWVGPAMEAGRSDDQSRKLSLAESSILLNSTQTKHLSEPERILLTASEALLEGKIAQAERLLLELLSREPHFRLAHALLADIQRVRAGLGPNIAAASGDPALRSLSEEWQRRLRAPEHLPPEQSWPADLLSFSPYSRHVLVVDASTLRLYWFQRPEQGDYPRLVSSFYISVGKAGVGKEVEGDNKTPLGIYRIIGKRPAQDLPAFYGAGALVLDYPNAVDRLLGRTGSGIWLHGSPPDTYTRDPLASEGCIVLANPDMRRLMEQPDIMDTPVLVLPAVQWKSANDHQKELGEAINLLQTWARSNLNQELDPSRLGIQRWRERDGHRYWRIEYRSSHSGQQDRHTWFLRESGHNLQHVAGLLPPRSHDDVSAKQQLSHQSDENPAIISRRPAPSDEKSAAHDSVLSTVKGWAKAWSSRNVQAYLAYYHPRFQPEGNLSRQAWQDQRRERILSKRQIEVELLRPRVQLQDKKALVSFTQRYRADGQIELRVQKTLVLQRENNRWLIIEERTR